MASFTLTERFAQAVGKLRRWYIGIMRPELVGEGLRERTGLCRRCGNCCHLLFKCPLLLDGHCTIYEKRPRQCAEFPVMNRDLIGLDGSCGYEFKPRQFPPWHPVSICRFIGIARYGVREVFASFMLSGIAAVILSFLSPTLIVLPVLGLAGILYFFRDPERRIPDGEEKLLAPADGKVTDIREVEEGGFIGGKAVRIGIRLSLLNVHVNRAPCNGHVEMIKYTPGKFHNAFGNKAASENENNLIGITDPLTSHRIAIKQIAGVLARRIVCDCRVEEQVERGQRIGMIKFGSRTELYVPLNSEFELLVKPGQKVRGGQTVLGVLRCEK